MSLWERLVGFDCGHDDAIRICKDGRSLVSDKIRCHECHQDQLVASEDDAVPLWTYPR